MLFGSSLLACSGFGLSAILTAASFAMMELPCLGCYQCLKPAAIATSLKALLKRHLIRILLALEATTVLVGGVQDCCCLPVDYCFWFLPGRHLCP